MLNFFLLILLVLSPDFLQAKERDRCVVVLSMDGFRWDYNQKYPTPNLDRIAEQGVRAESMIPSYPTKTFPNHYTLATGLYPNHHGIVQNSFYDPELDRSFGMGNRTAVQDSIFWEGEAIWETAEKQGVKTASYYWVGSENNERYRPSRRKLYEQGFPFRQQIDTVFSWLALPATERPRLVMFYFDQPDLVSHSLGPDHEKTGAMVRELDSLVGFLMDGLKKIERKQSLDIDLIVLSDHGMGNIPEYQYVFLEDVLDMGRIKRVNGGNPVITLEPEPDFLDEAYRRLRQTPHVKVWKREELPFRYHYGTHRRIPELVVEADSAWGLEAERKLRGKKVTYTQATHGYDPSNTDMHAIFYAMGPSFRKGYIHPSFENIHVYSLLAKLLGIRPAATDGNLHAVEGMLRKN